MASCTRKSGSFGLAITDRRCDDELAASGFLSARFQRTLAQKIQFVFVEAALQSKQQAVIA
jgi:hypothetical protein